jgi:hypothetical protein
MAVRGNPALDFFEQNPELEFREPCVTLLKNEKKQEASKIMWAIYMLEDPDSQFYRLPVNQRKEEIENNFLKDNKFDWEKYKYVVDGYPSLVFSKEKYMFKIWSDKLDQLTSYLKDLDFSKEKESEKALKIMKEMKPIWEGYEKVKGKMVEEESKTNLRGGAKQSSREKR